MGNTRIIIKLGTSTLTSGGPRISSPYIVNIARQISRLHEKGNQVILVSSGAIAAGREALNFPDLPKYIPSSWESSVPVRFHVIAKPWLSCLCAAL